MISVLTSSESPIRQVTLENGLTLIHHYTPTTPVVTVDVWVKAGAIVEPDDWCGMAHFLEHMIFKGSDRLPPGSFDQAIEHRGGVSNAATSYDYAHYFITTADRYLPDVLPYLAEILINAAIPDNEFERERDVVFEEIRQSYDNPDQVAFQVLTQTIYPNHPYGRPILGLEETLLARSPEDMRQFHRTHYQPNNMIIILVGNLLWEDAIDLVSQGFSQFQPRANCPQLIPEAEPPLVGIVRQEFDLPRLEQARLIMGWLTPGMDSPLQSLDAQLKRAYGLDLLSVLLTEGRTSRLTRELREERNLVQGVSSSFSLQRESGLFSIAAWLDPDNLERVEAIVGDRLSQLACTPVSEAELNRAKRLLCNDHAFSTETPSQLAGLYGYYGLVAHPDCVAVYPTLIQAIQPSEIQALASQYLSATRYVAIVVRPD